MKRKRQLAAMVAAVLMAWGARLSATADNVRTAQQLAEAGVSQR